MDQCSRCCCELNKDGAGDYVTPDGKHVCYSCFHDQYFVCASCGKTCEVDTIGYADDEDSDKDRCEECGEPDE